MKFKYGDILIDVSDPEDYCEVIFIHYEQDYKLDECITRLYPNIKNNLDCVVGIFGTEDNVTVMCSKNLWYKNGRHVLTEVCDV